ncbi:GRAM domain-containing protein [Purpureocillium lilacinum]|uniref:GRAM domain-containing protein n=1 Tax=Purpureocillium lilacinum TaxID=33203 RepID=A0A179HZD4_PURLI|nr:GRAM domain-containing protein [Purpureocillium lilacinum]OAQ86712.1 GRAM domain-containing protein [Purpureocillium lilacinum]OAQ94673.1 GRAM domain-containing protein [Purpureocillium lilacinum]
MDASGVSNGLDKLLPKSISARRRRRRQKRAEGSAVDDDTASRRFADSDDTNSTSMLDDDDDDGRSFASRNSSAADLEPQPATPEGAPRPAATSPPARPTTISAHPSLIGYLTTSSPVVQATHLDSNNHFQPAPSSQGGRAGSDTTSSPAAVERDTTAPPIVIEPPAAVKVSSADRRSRQPPSLETKPPRTPPTSDKAAPVIVNTPPTPTESGDSVRGSSPETRSARNGGGFRVSLDGSSPSLQSMSAHRRARSGSAVIAPSKLSNITTAPLTPTDESGEPTPSATGFFSSVLTAAQNAATTFSNTIPGTGITIGSNKSRTSLPRSQGSSVTSQAEPEADREPEPRIDHTMDRKESAIRTLGSGDLSLSQLGIAEPSSSIASPASAKFSDAADTRFRSESAPVDPQARLAEALPEGPASRPRSLAEATTSGDQTPPQMDLAENKAHVQRTSSIRSAIKPHRKRGSSVTTGGTGTTAAAAVGASNNSTITPSGSFGAPKLTGFAIASKKRNRDFHTFFKSVPDDDYLIEDYSCALQREILAHGRLYVSEGHLCFSSNILGWTTTLVMSFDEIVSVEKRSTALVFKNGLMISTLHAKHIFASFTSRDATYDLIVNIWKLGHPTLRSTLNGVRLEGTGGDKTEKVDGNEVAGGAGDPQEIASESEDDSEGDDEEEDFYDEEENDEIPDTQATEVSGVEADAEKPGLRKASTMTVQNGLPAEPPKETSSPPGGSVDFPGPATHPPTDCGDSASHYDKIVGDDIIAAPLGKVYNLMFGPASVAWMTKWLAGDQKCTEIQMDDKKGLSLDNKTRTYSYIKPLYASIGPKQTKCIVSETVDNIDLDRAVNVSASTQTPDVPSGNVFSVKTRFCLSWAENNTTRVQVNCTTEWTGKSWLKGPIEKGAVDGQTQHCKDLFAALKAAASSRPRAGTGPNGPARAKRKLKRSKALQLTDGSVEGKMETKRAAKQDWGLFEPVRGLVEPCADLVQPVLTGNVMYGLLVGLLVAMWFGFGSSPRKNVSPYGPEVGFYSASRLAAYEELWRREDSELWEWLDERVGLDRLHSDGPVTRKRHFEPRTVEEKLREERIDEREVEEAIRVTEEKLRVLREVVGKPAQSRDESGR